MAGASWVAAIADWLPDLEDIALARLGFVRGVPATTTMWRLLIRLDTDLLATILDGWLRTRTPPPDRPRRPRHRQVIAIDGKTVRGVRRADGSQVRLLSALDTRADSTDVARFGPGKIQQRAHSSTAGPAIRC